MKLIHRIATVAASTALALCAFAAPAFADMTLEPDNTYSVQSSLECIVTKAPGAPNFGAGLIQQTNIYTDDKNNATIELDLGTAEGAITMGPMSVPYTAFVSQQGTLAYKDGNGVWQPITDIEVGTQTALSGNANKDLVERPVVTNIRFPYDPTASTVELALFVDNNYMPTQFGGKDAAYAATLKIDQDSAKPYLNVNSASLSSYVFTYDGTAKKPKVWILGLTEGVDFTVDYFGNVNAGTCMVVATGKGNYVGCINMFFNIEKASQKLTVTAAKKTVKRGKSVYPITVKGAKGAKVFKKSSGSKYLTVASNGKVTLSKKAKKGKTYSAKVKVYAKATSNYKASAAKYVTVKVKAK